MEVSAGLAESNRSLPSGLWRDSLHVTCGLTACTPGSAPGQKLRNEYGKLYLFLYHVQTEGIKHFCDPSICLLDAPSSTMVYFIAMV